MKLLGDPHLGRAFVHGVPLGRRGDREAQQFAQFQKSLNNPDGDFHICMGDLFDKAIVPYSIIMATADAYKKAAAKNPQTLYVILKGNHDWLRDLEKPSAFDVFAKLVAFYGNIKVVTDYWSNQNLGFCAWHPTTSSSEMVQHLNRSVDTVFGHWDIDSYGGDDLNLIPTKTMAERNIFKAYTGHIHKSQEFSRDGVEVVVTGSMQPYAHGEESNDSLYKTVTKKELLEAPAGAFHNHCLRVHLAANEILDTEVDCLQLTVKKDRDDSKPVEVQLGSFDMIDLFKQSFQEAGVSDDTTAKLLGQYEASRISDG